MSEKIILTISGEQYDVTDFCSLHPGGREILLLNNGQDVTESFYYFQHSMDAKKILKTLNVKYQAKKPVNVSSSIWTRIRQKLFTKEDPNYFHKVLGISCFLNYLYRYMRLFLGHSTFTNPWDTFIWTTLHLTLNISAFKFHIPKERIVGKPMIWQEFRVHNLLFTLRSCLAMYLNIAYQLEWLSLPVLNLFKAILVYCILIFADEATERYREKTTDSTTRTMPYWEGCTQTREKIHKYYYAFSQFQATFACLSDSVITPFVVMMPIQISSFLMTLVRKGFLSAKDWHTYYFLSLFIPDVLYSRNFIFWSRVVPLSGLCLILRKLNLSKYVLWTVLLSVFIVIRI